MDHEDATIWNFNKLLETVDRELNNLQNQVILYTITSNVVKQGLESTAVLIQYEFSLFFVSLREDFFWSFYELVYLVEHVLKDAYQALFWDLLNVAVLNHSANCRWYHI